MLPSLPHVDFMRVNLVCDAMLDTLHWSGGNTTLDALACGLPVVTMPGAYMRGRQSAAMLRMLGVDELIAGNREDYIGIAARIARERAWRDSLSRRIRDAHPKLFGRSDALPVLWDILEDNPPGRAQQGARKAAGAFRSGFSLTSRSAQCL